jgi:hypothetical protein
MVKAIQTTLEIGLYVRNNARASMIEHLGRAVSEELLSCLHSVCTLHMHTSYTSSNIYCKMDDDTTIGVESAACDEQVNTYTKTHA